MTSFAEQLANKTMQVNGFYNIGTYYSNNYAKEYTISDANSASLRVCKDCLKC